MNHSIAIGAKVKQLRTAKGLTLKQLSAACGLSVGFLSQFERGLSSIALDALQPLAQILEVPMAALFEEADQAFPTDPVVHGVDLRPGEISPQIYQCLLKAHGTNFTMLPRIFILMPFTEQDAPPETYTHDGEEFVFVLEGVVSFYLEESVYTLYPGDSIHIHSRQKHNWMNRSNRVARLLTVNTPNPLKNYPGAPAEDTNAH